MARVKDGPEAELAVLRERRVELATLRDAADGAATAAQAVLDGITGRRQAAIAAEIDGTDAETVEQVDQARRTAEVTIADCRERAAVIKRKEDEIGEAQHAVIDRNPAFYVAKREAGRLKALAELEAVLEAMTAAETACRGARNDGGIVGKSCRRRGLEEPVEMPLADLGGAISEIRRIKQAWERLGELNEGHRSRTSLVATREQLQGPPGPEPLAEMIG